MGMALRNRSGPRYGGNVSDSAPARRRPCPPASTHRRIRPAGWGPRIDL